jgi:hypothetical protein
MRAPITVNYTPDGDDWTVTIAVAGEDTVYSARAVGLIAARDQADQMVAQIAPDDDDRRVVHLLDGDAYAFTNSYLQARLGLTPGKSTDQVINGGVSLARPRPELTTNSADTPADVDNHR